MNDKELTKARNCAYRYLSYRPRSRAEIERKLAEQGFPGEMIHAVLADLDRFGYVNDDAFARQWARSRARLRGFGRRRIEQELRDKGVRREAIREMLNEVFVGYTESDLARREAEKKLKKLQRFEPEVRRRRLAGFLERKGFSSDIIRTVLRAVASV